MDNRPSAKDILLFLRNEKESMWNKKLINYNKKKKG